VSRGVAPIKGGGGVVLSRVRREAPNLLVVGTYSSFGGRLQNIADVGCSKGGALTAGNEGNGGRAHSSVSIWTFPRGGKLLLTRDQKEGLLVDQFPRKKTS